MNQPVRIAGIPWYTAEDYDAAIRVMTDRDKFTAGFDVWLSEAHRVEQKLQGLGYITVRAFIDPETFPDWCRARGLNINAKARNDFANAAAWEFAVKNGHGK